MILASQSPRRRELLSLITDDFRIIPAKGEEILPEKISPENAVLTLSEQKADEIYRENRGEVIVAADTIVAIDGKILGKPADEKDAFAMLKTLSGRVHEVFTGVCVIFANGRKERFFEETKVEFYELSDEEIAAYIKTGEPMDKAGAYGIQGKGALLVKRIDGDYYNVMGLPVARLLRVLNGEF
ncbi:MAG: Maf family protein [Oscillospiraceae bacterium]